MTKNIINLFDSPSNILGEGLFVDKNGVYWLDITCAKLFIKLNGKETRQYNLPEQASTILALNKEVFTLASETGLCTFNIRTSEWSQCVNFSEKEIDISIRANDACCIGFNTYFIGTMEKQPISKNGSLYIVKNNTIKNVYKKSIGIPNSFIPIDDRCFLVSDSLVRKVYKIELDSEIENIKSISLWLDLSNECYTPDGGCIDSLGNIYIAMWGGACINKYNASAELLSEYKLPVLNPTNCKLSFEQNILYVTSAREGLTTEELKQYPLSGSVYEIKVSD